MVKRKPKNISGLQAYCILQVCSFLWYMELGTEFIEILTHQNVYYTSIIFVDVLFN
jgi:hypothetical protein